MKFDPGSVTGYQMICSASEATGCVGKHAYKLACQLVSMSAGWLDNLSYDWQARCGRLFPLVRAKRVTRTVASEVLSDIAESAEV